jgi:hypothetical protein
MELAAILRRQWILTCVMVVVTLVGVIGVLIKLSWTYQSTGSVVFLISKNSAKNFGGNPYLGFDTALNQTADVVRYEVMDIETANHLAAQGYPGSYLITDAIDTAGPVLQVQVTGHNKTAVEHTLYGVLNQISVKLNTLQAGVAPDNKIRELVIATSPKATVLVSKKARPLLEVLGIGFILIIGVPSIVDAVRTRRPARKGPRRESASQSESGQVTTRSGYGSDRPARSGYGSDRPARSGYSSDRPARSGYSSEGPDGSDYGAERRVPAPARPYDTADRNEATRRSAEPSERRSPEGQAKAARRP